MNNIKLVAIDIDGPLIEDSFSPAIKLMYEKFGGFYNAEVERNMFSRPRIEGFKYLVDTLSLKDFTFDDYIETFFSIRENYLKQNHFFPERMWISQKLKSYQCYILHS